MEFHPIADEWPLMEGEAFDALVASVARYGVHVPCWRYEGKILDGRNRFRAAETAGVPIGEWHEFEGSEAEAREFAKLLNDERRHLSKGDRAAWVAKLRAKGMSTRAIAAAVNVDQATVRRDLKSGEAYASPAVESPPPAITGRDGKQYAAARPQPAPPPPKPEPAAQPMTAGEWGEFFTKLAAVQEFTGTITQKSIPSEMPKWQLLKVLEETARAILATAARLRRSP